MPMNDPDPPDLDVGLATGRIIRRWGLVMLAGVLGATLAWAIAGLRPPVYESAAIVSVSLDYGRTPPLELIVEDRVLSRVSRLVRSDQTLGLVVDRLRGSYGEREAWSSISELRDHLRLDARLADWHFVGISSDPAEAALLAATWAEVGLAELEAASAHAWEALRIQSAPIIVACSELLVGSPLESYWNCLAAGPDLTAEEIERLREEVRLSRGVLPILAIESAEQATMPTTPVVYDRSLLIVAGLLAGLVLGAVVVATGAIPDKREE